MPAFIQPTAGSISPNFGQDRGDHAHQGVDIAAPTGTPVVASAAGRVTAANYSESAGNLVYIDHGGGWLTKYFHLQRSVVPVGAQVAQGQLIGYVGSTGRSTGPHLHFEVHSNGRAINPLTALQGGVSVPAPTPQTQTPSGSPPPVYTPPPVEPEDDGAGALGLALVFGFLILLLS